jgi:hypothetical protein
VDLGETIIFIVIPGLANHFQIHDDSGTRLPSAWFIPPAGLCNILSCEMQIVLHLVALNDNMAANGKPSILAGTAK